LPPDPTLLRLRGETKKNEEVHAMISWTTRKDYPLMIGIGLPAKYKVGEEFHEVQLWEETDEELIVEGNQAKEVYEWLCTRIAGRAATIALPDGILPDAMSQSVEEVTVQAWKDGKNGYILFTPNDSFTVPVGVMEVQVMIEYQMGYTRIGMGNAYTIRMLADEFEAVTQGRWGVYPVQGHRRLTDGTVVHGITNDRDIYWAFASDHTIQVCPPKILEERGRGTLISNQADQGKLLQFWAFGQKEIEVGVGLPLDGRKYEYWMKVTLYPIPDDEDPTIYLREAYRLAKERLYPITQQLDVLGDAFNYRMRYVSSTVRIWFIPQVTFLEGEYTRPFAEESCPKDKWFSETDLMAFMIPTIPDEEIGDIPVLIFGPDHWLQERYDDPEVQGGKIALIAFKQIRVQKPPSFLDHMQSRYLKQAAYNDRIIQAEKEIAAVNADIPEFLCEMNLDPADQVVIVVNGSEEMKRDEEAFACQLWMQGDRHMTAANPPIKGDIRSREAAILSAMFEAISWRHPLENGVIGPRKGQRVIMYPKEITGLPQVLCTRDVDVQDDLEDHSELYAAILQESDAFECPPLFLREDCDQITSHPMWSIKVPEWLITAARVATGNRRRVLENGPDVMNSDEEDAKKDEHGEELTGMYAPECASLDQARISEQQAQAQRALASSQDSPASVLVSAGITPAASPADPDGEDWSWMNPNQRKLAVAATKACAERRELPAPEPAKRVEPKVQAPATGPPLVIVKAAASPRAPADQPKGAKAPPRKKGQESPVAKATPPMATRSQTKEEASGAGGLRGKAGSGQTGAVCGKSSPARKPGS
jgi:hypothetical protein